MKRKRKKKSPLELSRPCSSSMRAAALWLREACRRADRGPAGSVREFFHVGRMRSEAAPSPFTNIVKMTASPTAVPERSGRGRFWGNNGVLWQQRLFGECKLLPQSSLYKTIEGHFCFPYKCQRALISPLLFVFLWGFLCALPLYLPLSLYGSTWKSDFFLCLQKTHQGVPG